VLPLEENVHSQIRSCNARQMKSAFFRHVREDLFVYLERYLEKLLEYRMAYPPANQPANMQINSNRMKKKLIKRAIWWIIRLNPQNNVYYNY
jgi:hypothetical protein